MRNNRFFLIAVLLLTGSLAHGRTRPKAPAPPSGPVVKSITITGNQAVGTDELLKRVTLKTGEPYKREQLRFSQGVLESAYRDKGYYEAHVSTQTATPTPEAVEVTFQVVEGALFHLGQVRVKGNKLIADQVILRNMEIRSGDVFSQTKVFDGNRQLYMTGYFDSIDIQYSTGPANTVDMTLTVQERATRFLKGGAGYGTQTKERITLGMEDLNFLGNARKLDISGTWSGFVTNPPHYETKIVQANLTQPYIFGSRYEAQTNVSREWDRREPYDSIASAWRTSVGRRFSSAITASMRYRYSATRVTRVSPSAETPGFTNVSAVGPTFTYDNTNDPFLPTLGWRISGTYEEGFRFFLGDVRFHKLESRAGRFDTLAGWTLFEGLQAGFIRPDSSGTRDIIPIYERYFLGGANSVRGYSERELGPRDEKGTPLGGNTFVVGNIEFRHRIYKILHGVTFFDAGQLFPTDPGNVWPYIRLKSINDLRYATGVGLRLHSPIGAIRLELGYKLNPAGGTGFFQRTGLHFSIGEVF